VIESALAKPLLESDFAYRLIKAWFRAIWCCFEEFRSKSITRLDNITRQGSRIQDLAINKRENMVARGSGVIP
jgi:hypothetical protein